VQIFPLFSHWSQAFAPFCGAGKSSHGLAFHKVKKENFPPSQDPKGLLELSFYLTIS